MGLDMYLDKKRKENKEFNFYHPLSKEDVMFLKDALNSDSYDKTNPIAEYIDDIKNNKIYFSENEYFSHLSDSTEVGYWRKSNQIHGWFVSNVQEGIDDCGHYEVTKEKLEELLDICIEISENATLVDTGTTYKLGHLENGKFYETDEPKMVLDHKTACLAKTLLPSQAGFFFGSTDYDAYYLEDINYTIDVVKKILDETDFEVETILYHSSW